MPQIPVNKFSSDFTVYLYDINYFVGPVNSTVHLSADKRFGEKGKNSGIFFVHLFFINRDVYVPEKPLHHRGLL